MGLLLKLLALAVLISLTTAKPKYVLVGPKVVKVNLIEKFCVDLMGVNVEAHVQVKLTDDTGVVYASTENLQKIPAECVDLYIPNAASQLHTAKIHLEITSKSEPKWVVGTVKEVFVSNRYNIPLVQTDRVLYRHGDLVKFRVFNLNRRLYPILEPISRVWVEDPRSNTIREWKDVETTQGVHQFEFEVPEQTGDGAWKILVEPKINQTYEKTFEVREFIVPQFNVELLLPENIYFNRPDDFSNQKIPITIKSRHGDFTSINGSWKAVIEVQSGRQMWYGKVPSSNLTQEKVGEMNHGQATFVLEGYSLGLNKLDDDYKIVNVTVTVTEKETGISFTKSWIKEVRPGSYDITLLSPTNFKHGLPYNGVFKVAALDGKSIFGTKIQICYDPVFVKSEPEDNRKAKSTKICRQKVADKTGIFYVDIFPTDPDVTSYTATVQVVMDDLTPLFTQILGIQAVYSPSNSFLSLIKPRSAVPCNSNVNLTFQYTATGDMNYDLYYIVMSGGQLLQFGTKHVSFHKEDHMELPSSIIRIGNSSIFDETPHERKNFIGQDYVELFIHSTLAPAASVLVYYVREDGEVVTSAVDLDIEKCFPNPVNLSAEDTSGLLTNAWKLKIKSGENSICALSVVDINVFSDGSDLQFSESKVFDRVMKNHIRSYDPPFQAIPDYLYCKEPETIAHNVRKRSKFIKVYTTPYSDAISAFDQAGLLVMSNLKLQTRPCIEEKYSTEIVLDGVPVSDKQQASPRRVNTNSNLDDLPVYKYYLPVKEQWELITLDENGEASKVIPDEKPFVYAQVDCVSTNDGFGSSSMVDIN